MMGMEQTRDQASTEATGSAPPPGELVRPVEGRVIAGVARGLSNRLGVSPLLIRAAFVVTAFVGGIGIALYAAGWALIRSENETEPPARRIFAGADTPGRWIGLALITVAALILLGRFTFISGEVLLALLILAIGALMYSGYIPGSRDHRAGNGSVDKEGVQPDVSN